MSWRRPGYSMVAWTLTTFSQRQRPLAIPIKSRFGAHVMRFFVSGTQATHNLKHSPTRSDTGLESLDRVEAQDIYPKTVRCVDATLIDYSGKDDDEINNHGDDKAADEELGEDAEPQVQENITEESIAALVASQTPLKEFQHGRLAVEIARMAKIFPNDSSQWSVGPEQPSVSSATGDDLSNLIKWRGQLERDVQQLNTPPQFARASDSKEADANAEVVRSDEIPTSSGSSDPTVDILGVEQAPSESEPLPAADPGNLQPDQRRAYDIILWHPPLRMLLHGEGGKYEYLRPPANRFTKKN
ncbi:hypothetical protein B0H14DRAFT_2565143 [Mycena olivaceomarginata]|nr:hypothetical protein B0H14DRAFT_2565143 [Mycena olivaceomarginata]